MDLKINAYGFFIKVSDKEVNRYGVLAMAYSASFLADAFISKLNDDAGTDILGGNIESFNMEDDATNIAELDNGNLYIAGIDDYMSEIQWNDESLYDFLALNNYANMKDIFKDTKKENKLTRIIKDYLSQIREV